MKIVSHNLFYLSLQSKLLSTETSLIIVMTVYAVIGTILLLIFLGYGKVGSSYISLSIALVVIFIILTIISLVLMTFLLMKKKTTILKTFSEVRGVYANPVLSKMPFPLYFDPLPKDKSFDINTKEKKKFSSASSEKDKVSNSSSRPSVRKKTCFFKKVCKFFKELAPPKKLSYSEQLFLQYQQMRSALPNEYNKGTYLCRLLKELSFEEARTIDLTILENSSSQNISRGLKEELESQVRNKMETFVYKQVFSPLGDGDCLLSAFAKSMLRNGMVNIPSMENLRLDATMYLKSELLNNNVVLLFLLNDFLECMGSSDIFLEEEEEKKEVVCERVSVMLAKLSENLVNLDMQCYNNVTATLTTSSEKNFDNFSFLVDFINIHAKPGIFCGPAMIYALAQLFNITVFLYTEPPLTKSRLALEGKITEDYCLCMTKENSIGCTGPAWKKNVIVFNVEANSENPVWLGLISNHFVSLDMQEMT